MPGTAPVLDATGETIEEADARLKRLALRGAEKAVDVVALAGGKLSYLWWVLIGDDFDVNPRELEIPRALAILGATLPGWDEAVAAVHAAVPQATFVSVNAKKYYFNVRWNNLRVVTDSLDRLALSAMGSDESDWRHINVLYRQVMRSSGDSAKGRYVTAEEYERILGW